MFRPTNVKNAQIDLWDFLPRETSPADFSPRLDLLFLDEDLQFTQTTKSEHHQPIEQGVGPAVRLTHIDIK